MAKRPTLTSESGAPVEDNQHSQSAGVGGPLLLQDQHLVEKLAHFNRERIPERVVHARGSAAFGTLTMSADMSQYTRAKLFNGVGKSTDLVIRFSTVAGSRGAPEAVRDPRGFSMKFYTEDGNYDLVGLNTPIFFINDPLKFPDFIHSQKPDPFTHRQEPNNVWDFFSHSPEATHQFTILMGDRGIPSSYRHMNGFGSHTFTWENDKGDVVYVKYHFTTQQGIGFLTNEEAAVLAGQNPESHNVDLVEHIEAGDFPRWTLNVQIMPVADAAKYHFNPFDVTKVWHHGDYPLQEIGVVELNRNADNYFAEVEQLAFSPANFVPGIGPSPDKMLQGRLFGYGDAQRYRLGTNAHLLDVNAPKSAAANNYERDGFMVRGANGGRAANYEPNSFDTQPVETKKPLYGALASSGLSGSYPLDHYESNDFEQAGDLFRLQKPEAQDRLIATIADGLVQVTIPGVVERSIGNFAKADVEYGRRIEEEMAKIKK
jgi:catalase